MKKRTVFERLDQAARESDDTWYVEMKLVKRLFRQACKEAYDYGVSDGKLIQNLAMSEDNAKYARKGTLALILESEVVDD